MEQVCAKRDEMLTRPQSIGDRRRLVTKGGEMDGTPLDAEW